MSFWDYVKEKWYMFGIAFMAIVFSVSVFYLGNDNLGMSSDDVYVLAGLSIFFFIYIALDFMVAKSRTNKICSFIRNGANEEIESVFPTDRLYCTEVAKLADEHNKFRSNTVMEHSKDLGFVTKWVHDVKVPISAIKLLLESDSDDIRDRLEMELSAVEQSIQNVLYNIKVRSFYDDYKVSKVGTKKMVASSLKQFATFFSHKKIQLKIIGDDNVVITDNKWSGYIISQFISNAVKHTKPGGSIEIETVKKEKSTVISVRNTGEGIEQYDLKNIFSRGYTAASRNTAYSTGYGLYFSKKLADKLGHKLIAESETGRYAKFSIIFFDVQ